MLAICEAWYGKEIVYLQNRGTNPHWSWTSLHRAETKVCLSTDFFVKDDFTNVVTQKRYATMYNVNKKIKKQLNHNNTRNFVI